MLLTKIGATFFTVLKNKIVFTSLIKKVTVTERPRMSCDWSVIPRAGGENGATVLK